MNKTYRYLSIPVVFLLFRALLPEATVPAWDRNPINEASNQILNGACADTINITLDANCQFQLTPDQLLTGDAASCDPSDLVILIDDENPGNGATVDGCGIWKYVIEPASPGSCGDFTGCWGYVRAEDKSAPTIVLPADDTLTLACEQIDDLRDQEESLLITGSATASDNCTDSDALEVTFTDQVSYSNDCDTIILRRTFAAEDEKGNRGTAAQYLTLAAPSLDDLEIDELYLIDADCDFQADVERDENGNIHPSVVGYPYYINGLGDTIQVKGAHCTLSATYQDDTFSPCESLEKTERIWTISDWCTGEKRILRQLIKFGDVEPPILACRQDTLFESTNPFACTGSFMLGMPEVTELCGSYEIAVEFYTISNSGPYGFPGESDTTLHQSFEFSTASQVMVTDVPIGCHYVKYVVRDECENVATIECIVCVADEIAPTVSCDDQINLSLNDQGYGQLTALELNEGTKDNCALADIEIRREYTEDQSTCEAAELTYSEWGEEVPFYCCDAGDTVVVELRATDIYGNQSTCWGTVVVEDKVRPVCTAPADVTIGCDELPDQDGLLDPSLLAELFGDPTATGNCTADIVELDPVIDIDHCGEGTITRNFAALDADGVARDECAQQITVGLRHDYRIKFPKDYEEFCAEPSPDSVMFEELGCDLIAVSIQDEILETRAEECYKILRTYRVINWCEYDGEAEPTIVSRDWDGFNATNPMSPDGDDKPGDEDLYVHVKRDLIDDQPDTVYYDNNEDPYDESVVVGNDKYGYWWRVISGSDDPTEEAYYESNGSVWANDGNQTDSDISGNAQGDDVDQRYGSFGFWQYTQHIKVSDAIPPEIYFDDDLVYCVDQDDCSANVDISFAVTDNCVTGGVDIDIDVIDGPDEFFDFEENPFRVVGRYPKYILDGRVPEGEYRIEISANDRCGNVTRIVFNLEITDCKAPAPICINGLATELMPVEDGEDVDGDGDADFGAMTVWASDFIASEIDDCTGPVTYSINRKGETPDIDQDFLIVTCDDPQYLEIEIHAWDNADNPFNIDDDGNQGGPNHDYCNTYILVQDNMLALCDPTTDDNLTVSGVIQTDYGQPIPDVTISSNRNVRSAVATDANGGYTMQGFETGYDYSLTPEKNTNPMEGVSTFDIVQISKHILNIKSLGSPYKHLAADVNRSGTITTLDLIQLRKLVLNIETSFPNGPAWRFVTGDYVFTSTAPEREAFPEALNLNNLTAPVIDADFVGVKMGDVTESLKLRSDRAAQLRIPATTMDQEGTIRVPVYLDGVNQSLEGLQFALRAERSLSKLIRVEPAQLTADFYHHQKGVQSVLVSWDAFQSNQPLRADQPLFYLHLQTARDIALDDVIQLDQRRMRGEAYTAEGEGLAIDLMISDEPAVVNALGSVFPNPFVERTQVSFYLDQPQRVTWTLTDAQGRTLRQWQENREAGAQQLILHANDLFGAGVYNLTTETARGVYTTRLVLLR